MFRSSKIQPLLKRGSGVLINSQAKDLNSGLCRCPFRRAHQFQGSIKVENKIGVGGYALLVIPVTTFCLGTWQVKRRKWKLGLLKELEEKTKAPAIDLPMDLASIENLEYRKVRVRGRFDHSREIYITPRPCIKLGSLDSEGGGLISKPNSGSFVITPFILSDRDVTILVNRGWVPRKQTMPHTRVRGQIDGEIEFTGVVRVAEKRPPFGAKNDPSSQFWNYRDVVLMSLKCDTEPIFIDADYESTVEGGPIGGQTRVSLRNEHLSYIFTWYSLSAATSFLWYSRYIKGKPLM